MRSARWLPTALVVMGVLAACGPDGRLPASDLAGSDAPTTGAAPADSGPLEASADTVTGSSAPATDGTTVSASVPEPAPAIEAVAVAAGCVPISVPTGSSQIIGERCDPEPLFPSPRPAALVLTGCGGYAADAEIGVRIAAALAREGIVAIRLDYLGAAPTPPSCDVSPADLSETAVPILQAVADTTALLRLDPGIQADSIGAVGYSLGALTVMSAVFGGAGLAPIEPVPLSAVALLSYPNRVPEVLTALAAGFGPPLYVLSGDDDDVTPPADSTALVESALAGGVAVEQLLVAGQGHLWAGTTASLAAGLLADELGDRLAG